jgi:hypothetical protein
MVAAAAGTLKISIKFFLCTKVSIAETLVHGRRRRSLTPEHPKLRWVALKLRLVERMISTEGKEESFHV